MNNSDQLNQVFLYFKDRGYSQRTFAAKIGLSQAQINRLLKGSSPVLQHHIILLECVFNINPLFWTTEKTDMFLPQADQKLDMRSKKILDNYFELKEKHRETLYTISLSLLELQKKDQMKHWGQVADKPEVT